MEYSMQIGYSYVHYKDFEGIRISNVSSHRHVCCKVSCRNRLHRCAV